MFNVERVVIIKHVSQAGVPQLKVCYYCAPLRTFYEYINFESPTPFVRKKASDWFRQRFPYDKFPEQASGAVPPTNDAVLGVMSNLIPPARIRVHVNTQHPRVLAYEF